VRNFDVGRAPSELRVRPEALPPEAQAAAVREFQAHELTAKAALLAAAKATCQSMASVQLAALEAASLNHALHGVEERLRADREAQLRAVKEAVRLPPEFRFRFALIRKASHRRPLQCQRRQSSGRRTPRTRIARRRLAASRDGPSRPSSDDPEHDGVAHPALGRVSCSQQHGRARSADALRNGVSLDNTRRRVA
jgi:hypothetical protein